MTLLQSNADFTYFNPTIISGIKTSRTSEVSPMKSRIVPWTQYSYQDNFCWDGWKINNLYQEWHITYGAVDMDWTWEKKPDQLMIPTSHTTQEEEEEEEECHDPKI